MSPATYGALFDDAHRHLTEGRRAATRRLDDKDQATATIAAYSGLLEAARHHVWALIVPARVAGVAISEYAHPVERAALAMADTLPPTPDDLPPRPPLLVEANHPWDQAAKSLRAASDLLATHLNPSGTARTPDAELIWDEVARHGALGRLGAFVADLVSTQEAMALRVGQAGLRWERVRRWLPPEGPTRHTALELVRVADVAGARTTDLDGLRPAHDTVRTGGAVDELGDRVARIRRAAWNLRSEPDHSIRTLFDVAHTGLQVAAHTAAFHSVDLNDPAATRHPYGRRTAAWLALLTDIRGYLGTGPGDSQIHTDVTAVRDLLATLVPDRPADHDRAASADPAERYLAGTLHGANAGLGHAAEWNAATFSRLARSGQVYLRIEDLTRDELSEHADLAATKLTDAGHHLIPAPMHRTEHTLDRYRDVIAAGTTRIDENHTRARPALARTDGHAIGRELPSAS